MQHDSVNDFSLRRRGSPAEAIGFADAGAEMAGGVDSPPKIKEVFKSVGRRKWLIAFCGLIGACLGAAVVILQPDLYTASTTLEIQGFNENFMNFSTVDPTAGSGAYSANALNIATQIRILQSKNLRNRAAERLKLRPMPTPPPITGYVQRLRAKLGVISSNPTESARQAMKLAADNTRVGAVRETRLIEIRTQSTIPEAATLYLNVLVSEYQDQTLEQRSNATLKTSEWLWNQLAEARARVDAADAKLQQFQRTTGYFAATPQETLAGSKLTQLKTELAASQTDRVIKQTNWERAKATPPESLGAVLQDPNLQNRSAQIADLKLELARLRMQFTDAYPAVRAKMTELAELERLAEAERQQVLERIRGDYEAALAREKLLTAEYQRQSRLMVAESGTAADREILQREAEIAQQAYNVLLASTNQASMAAAVPTNQVRIVDPAIANASPDGFGPIPAAAMGLLAGCMVAVSYVVGRDFLNRTVRTPYAAAQLLNVPELGVIPTRALALPLGKFLEASNGRSRRGLIEGSLDGEPKDVEIWKSAPSLYADSFRMAMTSLMISRDRLGRTPVLLISSPGPSEGKTTITANLGMAIAETGLRVVLLDMDLRHPGLHKLFGLAPHGELAHLVMSQEPLGQAAVDALIRPTGVQNLSVIPSMPLDPEHIQVLLYHRRFQQLLAALRQEFDFILIDSSPLGTFSDARALGRVSDGVLMVLRAGVTTKDSALEACRRLEEDGTPLIGTILNDLKVDSRNNYYYRYYSDAASPART